MPELLGHHAYITDLDGVVFDRGGFMRGVTFINGRLHPSHLPNTPLDQINHFDRRPSALEITSWREEISFRGHKGREIIPGVPERLRQLSDEGAHIYGNTGRVNKRVWVEMTRYALAHEGLLRLYRTIGFRPPGVSELESEVDWIRTIAEQYEETEFTDDSGKTVLFVAHRLPHVLVNHIHYPHPDRQITSQELEKYNIKVIPISEWRQG